MISILVFSESCPTNFIPAASNSGTYLGFTSNLIKYSLLDSYGTRDLHFLNQIKSRLLGTPCFQSAIPYEPNRSQKWTQSIKPFQRHGYKLSTRQFKYSNSKIQKYPNLVRKSLMHFHKILSYKQAKQKTSHVL